MERLITLTLPDLHSPKEVQTDKLESYKPE